MINIETLGISFDSSSIKQGLLELRNLGDAGAKTAGKLSLAGQAVSGAFKVIGGVAAVLEPALRAVVKINDEYARINSGLANVTASSAELATVQARLMQVAQETGSSYASVAGEYTRLSHSAKDLGLSQNAVLLLTEASHKAMQANIGVTGDASASVEQLSEAMLRGELSLSRVDAAFARLPMTTGQAMTMLETEVSKGIAAADMSPLTDSIVSLAQTMSSSGVSGSFEYISEKLGQLASLPVKAVEGFVKLGVGIGEFFGRLAHGENIDELQRLENEIAARKRWLSGTSGEPGPENRRRFEEQIKQLEKERPSWLNLIASQEKHKEASRKAAEAEIAHARTITAVGTAASAARKSIDGAAAANRKLLESLTLQTLTEAERQLFEYEEKIGQLQDLLDNGTIDEAHFIELADRFKQQYWDRVAADGGEAAAQTAKAMETRTQEAAAQAEDKWSKASKEIGDGLADALMRGLRSGADVGRAVADELKSMFDKLVLKPSIDFVMNSAKSFLGDTLSGLTDDLLGGIGKLLPEGIGAFFNAASPGFVGPTIPGSAEALGLQFGQSAGPVAAAAALQYSLVSSLARSDSQIRPGEQAALSFVPGMQPFIALDKVSGGNLFGTKFRVVGQDIAISITDGILDATLTTVEKRKKSLGRGSKWRTTVDEAAGLDESLGQVFGEIYSAVQDAAGIAGLELGEAFSFSFNQSIQGMDQAAIDELLKGVIEDASLQLTSSLIPSIESYRQENESLAQTFVRVVNEAETLRAALAALGGKMVVPEGLAGIEFTQQLTDLAGGLPALSSNIQTFYDRFYLDQEKAEGSIRTFSTSMADLGQQVPATAEEFRALVLGLEETDSELYVQLLQLADAADAAYDGLGLLTKAADDLGQRAVEEANAAVEKARENLSGAYQREIDLINEQISAAQEQADALNGVIDCWQSLSEMLRGFADDIRQRMLPAGAAGTAVLAHQFGMIADRARMGDQAAMEQLPGVGNQYADSLAGSARTREEMLIGLAGIADAGTEAANTADRHLDISKQQLQGALDTIAELEDQRNILQDQMDALDTLNETTMTISGGITALNTAMATQANAIIAAAQASAAAAMAAVALMENPPANITALAQSASASAARLMPVKPPAQVEPPRSPGVQFPIAANDPEANDRMARLESTTAATARSVAKTNQILKRVMPEGDALRVRMAE